MSVICRRLGPSDFQELRLFIHLLREVAGTATEEPSDYYVAERLCDDAFLAVAAFDGDDKPVGGLVAYEMKKIERERSEFYVSDIAVRDSYRTSGVADALLKSLNEIARARGTEVSIRPNTMERA